MIVLRDYQERAVSNGLKFLCEGQQRAGLILMPTGCHAKGHQILMFNGKIKSVEDVVVGDILYGPNGKPRTVLALARGRQEMRRIVPTKGEPFTVNLDHKLSIKKVRESKGDTPCRAERVETITVREYENGSKWYRHVRKLRRVSASFAACTVPLDPYLLGCIIGDGAVTYNRVQFTNIDTTLIEAVRDCVTACGCVLNKLSDTQYSIVDPLSCRSRPNRIMQIFRDLELADNNSYGLFVPDIYKVNAAAVQLQVLAALIDTDGYYCAKGNMYEHCTVSKRLADDVRFMCRSLGLAAYTTKTDAKLRGKIIGDCYRTNISGDVAIIPVRCAYKQARPRAQVKDVLCTSFKVESLPEDDYYGFTLDGDNLYLDANFVVHHNTGKSVVIGETVNRLKMYFPSTRIVMLTHVKELVQQNHEKAAAMCSHEVGLWSAGLRKKQYGHDIVFAGIDTVARNPQHLDRRDIILIDEAHRVAHRPNTNYRNVTDYLLAHNPNIRILGYTATGYRMGQGRLTDDWHNVATQHVTPAYWNTVVDDMTSTAEFNWFFEQGYLKRVVPMPAKSEIDVSNMRKQSDGEYNQADVDAAVNNANKVRAIVDEICENGFDRRSWMVFAAGNRNAELLTEEIRSRGVSVAVITDATPAAERDALIAAFKRYEIRCLVNNSILTTGFDHAGVDLIAVVRVTNSTPLWVQILGRGTRPVFVDGFDLTTQEGRLSSIFASGVYNCLVLDFAGNSKRLGAINDPVIPEPPQRKKRKLTMESPVKICSVCGMYNGTTVSVCENCGNEFPLSETITETASTVALIVGEHIPDRRKLKVTSMTFRKHDTVLPSGGSTSSIYVNYNCGTAGKFSERLSFAGDMSTVATKNWWVMFGDGTEIPASNAIFVDYYTRRIKRLAMIEVYANDPKKAKPYITYYGFSDNTFIENEEVA